MEKDKILENNKLIAEFLGWEERELPVSFSGGEIWMSQHKTFTFCSKIGEEMFHKSWDWLMPVVEKIENNNGINSAFTELHKEKWKNNYTFYIEVFRYSKSIRSNNKLECVYKAVVEFIKWYNEYNKKKK